MKEVGEDPSIFFFVYEMMIRRRLHRCCDVTKVRCPSTSILPHQRVTPMDALEAFAAVGLVYKPTGLG